MVATRASNRAKPPGTYRNYLNLGSASSAPSDDSGSPDDSDEDDNGHAVAGPSRKAKGKGKEKAVAGAKGSTGAKGKRREPEFDIRSESSGEAFQVMEDDEDEDFDEVGDDSDESIKAVDEDDEDVVDFGTLGGSGKASKRSKVSQGLRGKARTSRRREALNLDEATLVDASDMGVDEEGQDNGGEVLSRKAVDPYMDVKVNVPTSNGYRILQTALPLRPLRNAHLTAPPKLSRLSTISSIRGSLKADVSPCLPGSTLSRSWPEVERTYRYVAEHAVIEQSWKLWEGGEWYPECYAMPRAEEESREGIKPTSLVEFHTVNAVSTGYPGVGMEADPKLAQSTAIHGQMADDPRTSPGTVEADAAMGSTRNVHGEWDVKLDSTLVDVGLAEVGLDIPTEGYAVPDSEQGFYDAIFGPHAPSLRMNLNSAGGISQLSLPPLTAVLQGDGRRSRTKLLINAGQCIQKVAWCPMSEARSARKPLRIRNAETQLLMPSPILERSFKQYFAVLVPLTELPQRSGTIEPARSVVQIWSLQGHERVEDPEAINVDRDEGAEATQPGSHASGEDHDTSAPQSANPDVAHSTGLVPVRWGGLDECSCKCEAVIAVDDAWTDFQWMPLGCCDDLASNGPSKLGILTATCADGGVKFYSIADGLLRAASDHEYGLCTTSAFLTIPNDDASPVCLDYGSGSSLAVGFTHGVIRTWHDVPAMLRSERSTYPSTSSSVHGAPVNSVAYLRMPSRDTTGKQTLDQQPVYILSTGFDGATVLTDTRDPEMGVLTGPASRALARVIWFPFADTALITEADHNVSIFRVRRAGLFGSTKAVGHDGIVTALAASDFHGTIASGASDGSMKWTSGVRASVRTNKQRTIALTVFKLDYDPETGGYRMVEDMMPQFTDRLTDGTPSSGGSGKRKKHDGTSATMHPPSIGVNSVAFQSGGGLGRAGLCVSGMGNGLGRVDWMGGWGA